MLVQHSSSAYHALLEHEIIESFGGNIETGLNSEDVAYYDEQYGWNAQKRLEFTLHDHKSNVIIYFTRTNKFTDIGNYIFSNLIDRFLIRLTDYLS